MRFRHATKNDSATLYEFDLENINSAWSLKMWQKSTNFDETIISYDGSELVGFITYRVVVPEVEIYKLVTTKHLRRRGYGRALLQFFYENMQAAKVEKAFIEVEKKNQSAILFYKNQKFEEVDIRKEYYQDDDALILQKSL